MDRGQTHGSDPTAERTPFMKRAAFALTLMAAVGALAAALIYQSPGVTEFRQLLRYGGGGLAVVVLAGALWVLWRRTLTAGVRASVLAIGLIAATALALFAQAERRLAFLRNNAIATPVTDLAAVGRHVIVGYQDPQELLGLIARGAVGGVFVTARNAASKSVEQLSAEIAGFQTAARDNGFPPLVIATDQEGGFVSRLSPPLPKPQMPSQMIGGVKDAGTLDLAAIRAAAENAGRDLARVGVTLNFAPVADLNFSIRDSRDRHSRIADRAIARDPAIVGAVARAYCEGLSAAGVQCTLKHFPGLGRVAGDTHLGAARLVASRAELESEDWRPFREVIAATGAAIMVGHASLDAVDASLPASMSPAVIDGVLRDAWKFRGIIVTDDLTMQATSNRAGGTGAAAVAALAAGVDYVLVSYDHAQVYPVLQALLRARAEGKLGTATYLRPTPERLFPADKRK